MAEAIAEKKRQYEGMFILDANLGGKSWDKAKEQLTEMLESHGAEIVRMEKWEERKLTYEIRKHRRGVYVLAYFKTEPERLAKLKKDCRLAEWILREFFLVFSGEVTDDLFRKPRAREKEEGFEDRMDGPRRRGGPRGRRDGREGEFSDRGAESAEAGEAGAGAESVEKESSD